MKTAVLRAVQGVSRRAARLPPACLGLLLATGAATAADPANRTSDTATFTPTPLAATDGAMPVPGSVIEISSSSLPRFDNVDGRTEQRVDMALLSPGRASFGVTMGITGLSPSRYAFNAGPGDGLSGVNMGLQWRYTVDNNLRVDIKAWREMGRASDALALVQSRDPGYGARVELQMSGSSSPLVLERNFVGMRLDSGARITIKRSMGRPMLYYRNQF